MWRLGLLGLGLLALMPEARAQSWGWPYNGGYSYYRPQPQYGLFNGWDNDDDEYYRPRARGPAQQSGGAVPPLPRTRHPAFTFPAAIRLAAL